MTCLIINLWFDGYILINIKKDDLDSYLNKNKFFIKFINNI